MTQLPTNAGFDPASVAWWTRFDNWVTTLDQPTLYALRDSVLDTDVDRVLAALAPAEHTALDRPALLHSLLRFHIGYDHGRWEDAKLALAILRRSNLPPATQALFAASLALRMGDENAAWTYIEPVSNMATLPDTRLADHWYPLSEGRLDDSQRHDIFLRWLRSDPQLRTNALAWQRLGALALNQQDLGGAVKSFRTGIKAWLRKPMQSAARSATAAIADSHATTQTLLSLLAELRKAAICAFPIAGTLLGLEREGRLLTGDKDVDIACPARSLPALDAWLHKSGWRRMVQKKPHFANYFSYETPSWRIALDVFPHFPEPSGSHVAGWWLQGGKRNEGRFTRFPAYTLTTRSTPQGDITYPQEPAHLLAASYGDWRTPDPLFDTVVMAHNLVARSPLVLSYAYAHLLTCLLANNLPKAGRYAEWLQASDARLAHRILLHLA